MLMATRRSRSGNGSGRSRIPSTRVKMAVVAPMPSAKVTIAAIAKAGLRRSCRRAKVTSCETVDNMTGL